MERKNSSIRVGDSTSSSIPEVSTSELLILGQGHSHRRKPCVVRGAGIDLDIVKGMNTSNDDNDGKGGVQWLAQQAGSSVFRVFVSGPIVDGKVENNICGNNTPSTFTLDGTSHPDTVLTTSMSIDMTLKDMSKNQNWRSRYMVEDELPEGDLQRLVPPHPPSSLLAAFVKSGNETVKQRQLFVSCGPCQTQLHRDCFDNIYTCSFGQRHWTVAAPSDKLEREPGSVSASISPPDADKTAGPDLMTTTLCAGDAIFVPANFWHSVRSDQGSSVALNWYFEDGIPDNIGHIGNSTSSKRRKRDRNSS